MAGDCRKNCTCFPFVLNVISYKMANLLNVINTLHKCFAFLNHDNHFNAAVSRQYQYATFSYRCQKLISIDAAFEVRIFDRAYGTMRGES